MKNLKKRAIASFLAFAMIVTLVGANASFAKAEYSEGDVSEGLTGEVTDEYPASDVTETTEEDATAEEEVTGAAESTDEGVAFSAIERVGNVIVFIDAVAGVFPAGTEVTVTEVTDIDTLTMVADEADASISSVNAFDITFTYEGNEIQPNGNVSVVFEQMGLEDAGVESVYHISDEGNVEEVTSYDYNENQDELELVVDKFSIYAIVSGKVYENVYVGAFPNSEVEIGIPDKTWAPGDHSSWSFIGNSYGATIDATGRRFWGDNKERKAMLTIPATIKSGTVIHIRCHQYRDLLVPFVGQVEYESWDYDFYITIQKQDASFNTNATFGWTYGDQPNCSTEGLVLTGGRIVNSYYEDLNGNTLNGAPVNAGSYKYVVVTEETAEYNSTTYKYPVTISPLDLSNADLDISINNKYYKGSNYTAEDFEAADLSVAMGQVALALTNDFTLSFTENGDYATSGAKTVTINFTGNYTGSKTATFNIVGKPVLFYIEQPITDKNGYVTWKEIKYSTGAMGAYWSQLVEELSANYTKQVNGDTLLGNYTKDDFVAALVSKPSPEALENLVPSKVCVEKNGVHVDFRATDKKYPVIATAYLRKAGCARPQSMVGDSTNNYVKVGKCLIDADAQDVDTIDANGEISLENIATLNSYIVDATTKTEDGSLTTEVLTALSNAGYEYDANMIKALDIDIEWYRFINTATHLDGQVVIGQYGLADDLSVVRVYTKLPDAEAEFYGYMVIKRGATLEGMLDNISIEGYRKAEKQNYLDEEGNYIAINDQIFDAVVEFEAIPSGNGGGVVIQTPVIVGPSNTEIEEPDVPLNETPEIEESEEEEEEEASLEDIEDGEVALSENPLTGDEMPTVLPILALLAAAGMVVVIAKSKRK